MHRARLAGVVLAVGTGACTRPAAEGERGSALDGTEPAAHTVANVPYYDMRGGFCTPTSMRMLLAHHGLQVPHEVMANLTWTYGFHVARTGGRLTAFPTTDPPGQIQRMAEKLGFRATLETFDGRAAAVARIVERVARDQPVLVQWFPHTVVAYGYEEAGARILIQDPADLTSPLRDVPGLMLPFGLGEAQRATPETWEREPLLWQARRWLVVSVDPVSPPPPGSEPWRDDGFWPPVWELAAQRTCGEGAGAPATGGMDERFGVLAIEYLATVFADELAPDPYPFGMTFYFGATSRRAASEFLRAHADEDLVGAGEAFGRSADAFQAAHERVNGYLATGAMGDASAVAADVRARLQEIALVEREAAGYLFRAVGTDGGCVLPEGGMDGSGTGAGGPGGEVPTCYCDAHCAIFGDCCPGCGY